jgi:hypothetical protein
MTCGVLLTLCAGEAKDDLARALDDKVGFLSHDLCAHRNLKCGDDT